MAVVAWLIPSFPWAWLCVSASLGDPEPVLPRPHVLMDADTPSHTPGTDSCSQTVNPTLHGSKSRGLCVVIVHFEAEEEALYKKSDVPGPSAGAVTCGRCDFRPSGLVFAQLENGDSNSSLSYRAPVGVR